MESGNGDVQESSGYDPSEYARGVKHIFGQPDEDEGGLGMYPEKHATPTLRVIAGELGEDGKLKVQFKPWLMYGGVGGGEQDEGEGCSWFELYYRGIVLHAGERVFGDWIVRVEGEGLEPVARQIGRQVATVLKPGKSEKSVIRSVTLEPYEPKSMEEMKAEGE